MNDKHRYNILHLLPDLSMGGGQQVVLNTVRHTNRQRFAHHVGYFLQASDMAEQFTREGAKPWHFAHRGWTSAPEILSRLRRFVRREHIDLVHIQGTRVDKFYGETTGLLCRIPVVRTLHGQKPNGHRWRELLRHPRPRYAWRLTVNVLAGLCDSMAEPLTVRHFVAVSPAVQGSWQDHLRRRGIDAARVTVNSNAVSLKEYTCVDEREVSHIRRELELEDSYPVLVNIGRLAWSKNQAALVSMMPRIIQDWPRAKLLIAGEGDRRAHLETMIRTSGLGAFVRLLGQRRDIPALLTSSDLLVLSSTEEGLPLVLLEAMAAGKPVVCFDLPGLDRIVKDGSTGSLVVCRDSAALAEAVLTVAADERALYDMGRKARRVIEVGYSIDAWARRLEQVYVSVLEGSNGGPHR